MTPEYVEQLADLADPDQLWKSAFLLRSNLPENKRQQLDAGVALRRYAHHLRDLATVREKHQSWLITPLTEHGYAVMSIPTPPEHEKLREGRQT